MNWIRENAFWSSITGILVVLVGITGYVYFSTPLTREKEQINTAINDLNSKVQASQQKPDDEAPIPPRELIDRLRKKEQMHQEDIGQLSERLLELGKGIESWFGEKRFPSPGFFESIYQEEREKISSRADQQLPPIEQEGDSSFLGGGGDEDEQRIDWPDDPTENMQKSQKRFWVIKRLIEDMISAEAVSFQDLGFADQPDPITIIDGQELLQRYIVTCDVILPPENIGDLLARFLQVDTGEKNVPNLMLQVRNYRLVKQRTTPQILAGIIGDNERAQFAYPSKVSGDLENWQPGETNLPADLHQPSNVKLEIAITVFDPHEPTLISLLKEAGYESAQLQEVFQPFYTEEEFNGFLGGNN